MGSDLPIGAFINAIDSFQFTLPCGERHIKARQNDGYKLISIHAPVWGATNGKVQAYNLLVFQFTLPCGERRVFLVFFKHYSEFQFTLPCGERQWCLAVPGIGGVFQFTLPCGERQLLLSNLIRLAVFQFTLPCGERHNLENLTDKELKISIHAPVWGATTSSN